MMDSVVIVHLAAGPIIAETTHKNAPPIVMLKLVATVISIFFEIILVIIPPKAPHMAFRRIIPSPLNEIP